MATHRPFRFAVSSPHCASRAAWLDNVHKAEDLGYTVLLIPDHVETSDLSPGIALMSAAEHSKTLRIGTWVYNSDIRHPTALAKEVATLDLLSEGRFEFGVGPGYLPEAYEHTGVQLDPASIRIARMEEALTIMKQLFTQEKANFSGTYYQIKDLQGIPKPIQKPYPPIYIGGGGKRILSLAARQAEIVGLTAIVKPNGQFDTSSITAEASDDKYEWIRQAAGDRFQALEINSFVFVVTVTDHREAVAGQIAPRFHLTNDQFLNSPHILVGTVDQICANLQAMRERYGISYITIPVNHIDALAPVVARLSGK